MDVILDTRALCDKSLSPRALGTRIHGYETGRDACVLNFDPRYFQSFLHRDGNFRKTKKPRESSKFSTKAKKIYEKKLLIDKANRFNTCFVKWNIIDNFYPMIGLISRPATPRWIQVKSLYITTLKILNRIWIVLLNNIPVKGLLCQWRHRRSNNSKFIQVMTWRAGN